MRSSSRRLSGGPRTSAEGGALLAYTAAGGDPLAEEALYASSTRWDGDRRREPTTLEVLLTERVVSLWMLTALLEVLVSAPYQKVWVTEASGSLAILYHPQSRILESATRRYLAAIGSSLG